MSEASFASLGPTLLARKGGAKPAMRPQLAPLPETVNAEQLEDLGWNDMGQEDEHAEAASSDVVPLKPAKKAKAPRRAANEDSLDGSLGGDSPLVAREQQRIAEHLLKDAADAPLIKAKPAAAKTKKPAARKAKAAKAKRASIAKRAAFTLRLDTDRHLKLRLAATMQGKSAQALVTEALDAMLLEIDDLDALASRMKRN